MEPTAPHESEPPLTHTTENLGILGPLDNVKALTFDVFGTVVDYRSSIIAEGRRLSAKHGFTVDWPGFADAWRGAYRPAMDAVMRGGSEWVNVDGIYRSALDKLLDLHEITNLTEQEITDFCLVWHRLEPWGDSVPGLERLRRRFILSTLSNGNVRLLVDLARHAKLPWDVILSSEIVQAYKPDPRAYQMATDLLGLHPSEVMMVAAHQYDLDAAHEMGMRTAFVMRPLEHGPEKIPDLDGTRFDIVATDMVDLARQLGL